MNDSKKYRHEIKYLCSDAQLALLEMRVKLLCKPDKHAGEQGRYTVRSVYFDDCNNSCFYENLDGVNEREKMRIRLYDGNTDYILLECKSKLNGKNHKDSCRLTAERCEGILKGDYRIREEDPEVLKKLLMQCQTRLMRPKVIVQYDRTPYVYGPGNVRITFDRNISGCGDLNSFTEKEIKCRPVLPPGYHVLEVKYDAFFPEHIKRELQGADLRNTAFSKYAICRKTIGV